MPQTALLIIDVQQALVDAHPYNKEAFLANLQALLALARQNGIEAIYIRHDDGPGSDFERGTKGWEIASDIAPPAGTLVIDKKKNSAFKDTELHGYLQAKGVGSLILAGMQTEYCVDATCKSAFDLGYAITIPRGCTTTFDNGAFSGRDLACFYEDKIWHNRFAQVVSIEEAIRGNGRDNA